MAKLKNIVNSFFDFFEIYIPIAMFIVVFFTYIVIIAYRYIFCKSFLWVNEISTFAYVWCMVFSISYGSRTGTHVAFSILYDKLTKKRQLIFRLIGNLFIFITFLILIPSTYESIIFMGIKKSPVMKIPYSIVFLPFLIFVVLTLIHHAIKLAKDINLVIMCSKGKVEI